MTVEPPSPPESQPEPQPEPPVSDTSGPGLRIPVAAPGRAAGERTAPAASSQDESADVASVYRSVGGQPFFDDLAGRFYDRVRNDPTLLALYPDQQQLGPATRRLSMFLAQYWGGPGTYSEERGHPRLRMRHAPYRIDSGARDHWLDAMLDALDHTMGALDRQRLGLSEEDAATLDAGFRSYFRMAADHLVNADG